MSQPERGNISSTTKFRRIINILQGFSTWTAYVVHSSINVETDSLRFICKINNNFSICGNLKSEREREKERERERIITNNFVSFVSNNYMYI